MTHDAVRNNYNRLSPFYDLFTGSESRFSEKCLQMLEVCEGEKVLEIGFGSGKGLISLAHSTGESGKVYGIDLSEGMLQAARKKVSIANLSTRIEIQRGDAIALPYGQGTFHALFMSFSLELFNLVEIPIVLGECRRVLHDGGRLGVTALADGNRLATRIYKWFHLNIPAVFDCQPINLCEAIDTAGFAEIRYCEGSLFGLTVGMITARKDSVGNN
jgi:demethylmenaquinone methyltransferase/2-methoxy-6-polyprenyl-1,4-benzoquinol methylase